MLKGQMRTTLPKASVITKAVITLIKMDKSFCRDTGIRSSAGLVNWILGISWKSLYRMVSLFMKLRIRKLWISMIHPLLPYKIKRRACVNHMLSISFCRQRTRAVHYLCEKSICLTSKEPVWSGSFFYILSINSAISGGSGASIVSFSPVNGWFMSTCLAWRAHLFIRSRFPPYNVSPAKGCPRLLRWTRIWCVLPVSNRSLMAVICKRLLRWKTS